MHQRLLIAALIPVPEPLSGSFGLGALGMRRLRARKATGRNIMGLNKLMRSIILGVLILLASEVRADFLGLAPGDYTVTLLNSGSFGFGLCGGNDCTGSVHIGNPGATGFDWNFIINGDSFQFDGPTMNTSISPNGEFSCAFEANGNFGGSCQSLDGGNVFPNFGGPPGLALLAGNTGILWFYKFDGASVVGQESARTEPFRVPEPLSCSLLLFGLGALGVRHWLRPHQD